MEPRAKHHHVSRFINLLAEYLSSWRGFVATVLVLLAGIAIGAMVRFDENFMLGFNLFLSVAAIVLAGIILVAGARSEAALHVKLDYLIEYSRATNTAIGIEHKDVREIEEERERVEMEAASRLGEVVGARVAEELAEKASRRERAPPA